MNFLTNYFNIWTQESLTVLHTHKCWLAQGDNCSTFTTTLVNPDIQFYQPQKIELTPHRSSTFCVTDYIKETEMTFTSGLQKSH